MIILNIAISIGGTTGSTGPHAHTQGWDDSDSNGIHKKSIGHAHARGCLHLNGIGIYDLSIQQHCYLNISMDLATQATRLCFHTTIHYPLSTVITQLLEQVVQEQYKCTVQYVHVEFVNNYSIDLLGIATLCVWSIPSQSRSY